jgi:hypothetical protein
VAALVAFREEWLSLEIGAGQVVEQDVEAGVEQIAPAADQVIEQCRFVIQQAVVAAVEFVDLRQADIAAEQVGQRVCSNQWR